MAGPRETIEPHKGDKRYARRDARGRFTSEQSDGGRSLTQDREQKAQHASKPGYGDRGDRRQS